MAMKRGTRLAVRMLLPIWLAMPLSGFTQPRMGMPMYDKRAEVTVTGTVDEVREMAGMGGMAGGSMRDMHVMLKTDKETFEVHLGPVHYLKEQKVDLAKGDAIEVSGARVTMGSRRVILARELRKGNQTWTLRDADGRPRWRMAPSRHRPVPGCAPQELDPDGDPFAFSSPWILIHLDRQRLNRDEVIRPDSSKGSGPLSGVRARNARAR